MEAHLYIMGESFQNNSGYSDEEIEEKVKRLAEDVININKYSQSNKLLSNYNAVYPLKFHSNYTLEDFLCRPLEVKKTVDRDVVNALQKIFEKAINTNITSEEVIQTLLPWHDQKICHGLIVFHKVEGVADEAQLIYGIDGWYKFRRLFLGLYPNSETFISECSKYFTNLCFHDQNNESIKAIINNFSLSIVKHLGFLNDVFFTYRTRSFPNESIKYKTFTSECNLESDAAPKDNNDSKKSLTFEFINIEGKLEAITCYPHLRLSRSDQHPGDGHHYQHRIYFHEGLATIQNGKILIGHIGLHLN